MDSLAQQDQDSFSKQYDAEQAAKKQQETQASQPPTLMSRYMPDTGRVTVQHLDDATSDNQPGWFSREASDPAIQESGGMRTSRNVAAGAMTGASNIADAAVSGAQELAKDDLAGPLNKYLIGKASEIWNHAKSHILDFRDAVQVSDPTLSDNLTQGAAQLAIPFAGYSRGLAGLGGFAKMVTAGAATDATALGPHDPRMADLLALGMRTQGKLGDVLRSLGPHGLNSYINYITDNHPGDDPAARSTHETEAQGRWLNVLDGFGANLIVTPLVHAAGIALKQGYAGLRVAIDNGVGSAGGLLPAGTRATQEGKIGYHGSPEPNLTDLKPSERLSARGHGIYLSEDKDVAGAYKPTAGGKLYNVNVPDEQFHNMLHWDVPLKQQPIAQHIFHQLGISGDMTAGEAYRALSERMAPAHGPGHVPSTTGFDAAGDKAASEALAQAGVPGIRYSASGKYSQGGSTKENMVVFDAKHAKIMKPAEPKAEEK